MKKNRKWLILFIIATVIIGTLSGCSATADTDDATEEVVAASEAKEVEVAVEESNTYKDGMYKVGTDIMPGLYKVEVNGSLGMGYVERSKDASMTLDSILANILLTGDGYAEIKDTDAFVKVTGAILTPFDISTAVPSFVSEYEDGLYLVGIDIEPGEYKVDVADTASKMGYVERLSDVSYNFDSIISNSIIQNQAYVTIDATDFAIRLQGVKLSK
jgi:hypothetical protein